MSNPRTQNKKKDAHLKIHGVPRDRSAKWANIGFLDPDTAINQEGKGTDGGDISRALHSIVN